ncbi:MAG TPA: hypothetical protein VES89_00285 [Candidatus Competibacteraceae bacterium]|nr:hypothetical protein [Candidatus Competibacteraceae bacterium]
MIRRLFLMAAVVVFALDMLGVWRRWSSVDPIALGLGLGFAAFLV